MQAIGLCSRKTARFGGFCRASKIGHVHIRDVCIIFMTSLQLKWFRPVARGCEAAHCVGDGMDGDLYMKYYQQQEFRNTKTN